jgi:predicted GNAT family N-acyltransferase
MQHSPQHKFTVREVKWEQAVERLRAIRECVFIREQGVPEELEWDGLDAECIHLLAETGQGDAIGTVRLLADGHIGRMAVLKEWRGKGVGRALLLRTIALARDRGLHRVVLNAQTTALGFYQKAGFKASGGEFMDAGIPHYRMELGYSRHTCKNRT